MTNHTPGPLTTKVTTSQQFDQRGDTAIISNGQIIGEAFARSSAEDEHPAEANATLWAAAPDLADALEAISDMKPEEFAFPSDWDAQVSACPECRRYATHPIQQGICDEHRRPLWARKKHDAAERAALGGRMRAVAEAALRKAGRL